MHRRHASIAAAVSPASTYSVPMASRTLLCPIISCNSCEILKLSLKMGKVDALAAEQRESVCERCEAGEYVRHIKERNEEEALVA